MKLLARLRLAVLAVLAGLALASCSSGEPRQLVEGRDNCDYCRMSISDMRFGAQVITGTGKVHTFDSVECLAGFVATLDNASGSARSYVSDFENPGTFILAQDAVYLMNGSIESPMGRRVVAFAPTADSASLTDRFGGTVHRWSDLARRLAEPDSAMNGGHDHGPMTPAPVPSH